MTNKTWILYRHTSPSNKVYIGITSNKPYIRWRGGNGYKSCKLFYRAILKYSWNNIKHEVLFTGLTEDRAKKLEIELIRHYKALGISYNITDGGDGMIGYKHSQEIIKKLKDAHIGRIYKKGWKWTEEQKANKPVKNMKGINNPNYGNHKLAGENNPMYGKTHTEEARRKMALAATGRTHKLSEKHKELLRKINSKPVVQLDLDNNIVAKFESSSAAARFYGKGASTAAHIAACCRGERKKCLNYKWIYG